MSQLEVMAVVWIATMISLGLQWQRTQHWKARHDFDHDLASRMTALVESMEPTERTWAVLRRINNDADFKIILDKEGV